MEQIWISARVLDRLHGIAADDLKLVVAFSYLYERGELRAARLLELVGWPNTAARRARLAKDLEYLRGQHLIAFTGTAAELLGPGE